MLSLLLVAAGATPAFGATAYELVGEWVSPPATIAATQSVTAEWRVSVNDDAAAPGNAEVEVAPVIITVGNGKIISTPEICKTGSQLSADGRTLTCLLGTQAQGSSFAISVPVTATGTTGDELTMSGSVSGIDVDLTPIPIVTPFGMDMVWSYSQGTTGSSRTADGSM